MASLLSATFSVSDIKEAKTADEIKKIESELDASSQLLIFYVVVKESDDLLPEDIS